MNHFRITKKYLYILPLLAALSIGVLPLCPVEAAAPQADSKTASAKMGDPVFAVPVMQNPLTPQALKDMEIAEQNGRWIVSAKSLEQYGVREVAGKPGSFRFRVPPDKNGQTHWTDPVVELALPGVHGLQGGYDVSFRHIRRPLGISYELEAHDKKLLLPPKSPVYIVPELKQQTLPRVGNQKANLDTVILWDPKMIEQDTIPDIKSKAPVISPCAFSVSKQGLELKNPDFDTLIENYQTKGYAVWPLVDNHFNPALTHDILMDKALQDTIIKELIGYAVLYGLNGYNIDFENINYEDKDRFSSFVAAVTDACHAYGLVTSVDVTPLSDSPNWSMVYDRKALGNATDYIALMAYDEYPRGSKVAGPVASFPWVEKGTQELLTETDSHKIVLGFNFYMRIWFEAKGDKKLPKDPDQWHVLDTAAPSATPVRLDVRTLSLADSRAIMKRYGSHAKWDENLKLNYMELPLDIGVVKIWFEDEKSLKERIALIKKYQLAGAAFWRKGFEAPQFWKGFGKRELT